MALAPVSSSERVPTLDVLRGLALYGVLTANLVWIYSGLELLPPGSVQQKSLAGMFMGLFVSERAITTLTFLFGLGFAVQLGRAEARGEDVRGVFVRRLLAMLLFGVAHVLLLWWGDILWSYAITGFALLWFRRCRPRTLLVWAIALIFVPRLVAGVPAVREMIMAVVPRPDNERLFNAEVLAALAGTDRAAMTWAHLQKAVYGTTTIGVWFFPWILGHFLLGMAAGKVGLFAQDGAPRRRLFRWLLAAGIALVVIGLGVMMTVPLGREAFRTMPLIAQLGLGVLRQLVTFGVVAIYLSAVVLLMQRRLPRRLLMLIAPVGRMPLTTYLSQSLIATFIFYGWGLGWVGEIGISDGMAIAAGIFVAQVVIANVVLRRFRSGPMEWLWRAITYRGGRRERQPEPHRVAAEPAEPAAPAAPTVPSRARTAA